MVYGFALLAENAVVLFLRAGVGLGKGVGGCYAFFSFLHFFPSGVMTAEGERVTGRRWLIPRRGSGHESFRSFVKPDSRSGVRRDSKVVKDIGSFGASERIGKRTRGNRYQKWILFLLFFLSLFYFILLFSKC